MDQAHSDPMLSVNALLSARPDSAVFRGIVRTVAVSADGSAIALASIVHGHTNFPYFTYFDPTSKRLCAERKLCTEGASVVCWIHECTLSVGCAICGLHPLLGRGLSMAGRCFCPEMSNPFTDLTVAARDRSAYVWIARESAYMVNTLRRNEVSPRSPFFV
jgi:hypothetical protein